MSAYTVARAAQGPAPSTGIQPSMNGRCPLFLQGICTFGSGCEFVHHTVEEIDAIIRVDPSSPQVPHFAVTEHAPTTEVVRPRGAMRSSGRPCKSATIEPHLPSTIQQSLTPQFDSCPPTEINKKPERTRTRSCHHEGGKCLKGDRCSSHHDPERQAARIARKEQRKTRRDGIMKDDAANTVQHIVLNFTVVTFGAGAIIQNILLGFESCRVWMKNLPLDVNSMVAEVSQNNSVEGMRGSGGSTLDISWHLPSVSYVVAYTDVQQAEVKVRRLDGRVCARRRVKVEINRLPMRQFPVQFSVTIKGLPLDVTDADVKTFSGSGLLRRLEPTEYDVAQVPKSLRCLIETLIQDRLKFFENVTTDNINGISTTQAHFNTWNQSKKVYDFLDKRCFCFIGEAFFQLRFISLLHYTIVIPAQQYRAQRRRWRSLLDSAKGKSGCSMYIDAKDNITCLICIEGDDRKAVGSLKLGVENLAAGETFYTWHESLGQRFLDSVFHTTGAFVRDDWRNRVLKTFGEPSSVDAARTMVISEIERLESLDHTVSLKRRSVRFFLRQGLKALKEDLGDDSITLDTISSSCSITIKDTELAKHTLNGLIEESLDNLGVPEWIRRDTKCPICHGEISCPVHLACGHSYCVVCIRHFLDSASKPRTRIFPLSCIGNEGTCSIPIPIPVIQRYLLPRQFKQLLEAAFFDHIERNPREFKYCRTPDCGQIYRCNKPSSSILHCPSCLSAVCSSCYDDAHDGLTCAEAKILSDPAEQERLNDELAKLQGFKRCPNCEVWIDKTAGCNHMTCRCGAEICWVCMTVFTDDNIYNHMRTVHGGLFGGHIALEPFDGDALGEVNYAAQGGLLRQARGHRPRRLHIRRRELDEPPLIQDERRWHCVIM